MSPVEIEHARRFTPPRDVCRRPDRKFLHNVNGWFDEEHDHRLRGRPWTMMGEQDNSTKGDAHPHAVTHVPLMVYHPGRTGRPPREGLRAAPRLMPTCSI